MAARCTASPASARGRCAPSARENPYQQEHDDFFHAIRHDLPYNEADYGAKSTLTAIMGRMAAYSGKIVEWDAALNSNFSLAPGDQEHGRRAAGPAGRARAL